MEIYNLFSIGDVVYSKTDKEQREMIVTGIMVRPNKSLSYAVSCDAEETYYYDFEICIQKDILKSLS